MLFYDRFGKEMELPVGETVSWRPSVYGLLEKDGKALMIKDGFGYPAWEFPGGGIAQNEEVVDALVREFQEETGYKVRPLGNGPIWVGCRNFFNNSKGIYVRSLLMLYRVELVSDAREPLALTDEDEGAENITHVEWIDFKGIDKSEIHSMWHKVLELI